MQVKIILSGLILLLLISCGYTLHKNIPIDSVRLGRIENMTFEHGLEDRLYVALTEELMKNGIRLTDKATHSITGVIDKFELRGIAQKVDITVQFEVFISGRFFLNDGKSQVPLRGGGLFPVTFATEGTLEDITAVKEEATERALRDLSVEIVAGILYK